MTGAGRFVCSDPDAGDFEFADVEAVLDGLEAALLQPATPIFDAARQSWQPVGLHPEIRARLGGSAPLPSAVRHRARPPHAAVDDCDRTEACRTHDEDESAGRREAYARMRAGVPVEVRSAPGRARTAFRRRRCALGAAAARGGRLDRGHVRHAAERCRGVSGGVQRAALAAGEFGADAARFLFLPGAAPVIPSAARTCFGPSSNHR